MKVISEINHPTCKITIYSWNNKFIFKFETQLFEQTYKVSQTDLTGEESVNELISDKFMQKVLERFKQMDYDWDELVGDDF
jgi:hypothetical protein